MKKLLKKLGTAILAMAVIMSLTPVTGAAVFAEETDTDNPAAATETEPEKAKEDVKPDAGKQEDKEKTEPEKPKESDKEETVAAKETPAAETEAPKQTEKEEADVPEETDKTEAEAPKETEKAAADTPKETEKAKADVPEVKDKKPAAASKKTTAKSAAIILNVKVSKDGIMTWNPVDGADQYTVYVNGFCTWGACEKPTINLNRVINKAIKEEELKKGSPYKIKIWAEKYIENENGNEDEDGEWKLLAYYNFDYEYETKAEPVKAGKVTGVKISNGNVTWNKYPGAYEYEINLVEPRGEGLADKRVKTNTFGINKWVDSLIKTRDIWRDDKYYVQVLAYDIDDVCIAGSDYIKNYSYASKATPNKITQIKNVKISKSKMTWDLYAKTDHYNIRVIGPTGYWWIIPKTNTVDLEQEIRKLIYNYDLEETGTYNIELYAMSKNNEFLAEWTGKFKYKESNTLTVKAKTAKVKYKKLRKKTQKLSRSKVMNISDSGQGYLTFEKLSGNKKIMIDYISGKVYVKKKLKKGTYKVKVRITASGNETYAPVAITVTFKIKVKK